MWSRLNTSFLLLHAPLSCLLQKHRAWIWGSVAPCLFMNLVHSPWTACLLAGGLPEGTGHSQYKWKNQGHDFGLVMWSLHSPAWNRLQVTFISYPLSVLPREGPIKHHPTTILILPEYTQDFEGVSCDTHFRTCGSLSDLSFPSLLLPWVYSLPSYSVRVQDGSSGK